MERNMKKSIVLLALGMITLFLIYPEVMHAQQRKAGLTGMSFLKVGVGARPVAMGSAATSITNDVNQMFWNPAGMALEDYQYQATFSYNRWIADLNHNAAGFAYNLGDLGTIGIGFVSFGISDIPANRQIGYTDPDLSRLITDQASSATYDYMDVLVQLSYARYFFDRLALGVNVKYINQSIDDQSVGVFAVDMGSVYKIGVGNWQIAARMSNLGSDYKYYNISNMIPLTFSLGTSAVLVQTDLNSSLTVALDAVKPQDGPQYYHVGGEWTFMNTLSLRAGWKVNYSGTESDLIGDRPLHRTSVSNTIENLSLGAGINVNVSNMNLQVDYSMTHMDILDNVHRISVRFGSK
jgi:hypothetical protein